MTYQQAAKWAKQMGMKVRANDQAVECWIARVEQYGQTGRWENRQEAERYAGPGR
ncbi:MAG TPA: hypothetical protein VF014_09780 [Casimicrobiaceae bacterium]|nr:hypothetical protein [Casimicrobiaceae bacterium]